jgi:hypothetical protein
MARGRKIAPLETSAGEESVINKYIGAFDKRTQAKNSQDRFANIAKLEKPLAAFKIGDCV